MKKLLTFIGVCLLLISFSADAGIIVVRRGDSECLGNEDEGFEGVGAPANWSTSGGDFDDTNNPLECTEGLRLEAGEYATYDPAAGDGYDASEQYWTFWWYVDNEFDASNESMFSIYNSGATRIARLRIDGAGDGTDTIEANCEGGSSSNSTTVVLGATTYKFRVHVTADTGANDAMISVEFWSGSEWLDLTSCNDGTTDGNISYIIFWNEADTEVIDIDYFKDSATAIASPD